MQDRSSHTFSSEITDDEAAFGFAPTEIVMGAVVAVAELSPGLLAVKVRGADDALEYRVCDRSLAVLYPPARSLDDLRRRFRSVVA